jgi:hypothetical protein
MAAELQPHQKRVMDEKLDLDLKIMALTSFIQSSNVFSGLPEPERMRLYAQRRVMAEYSTILGERIAAF